MFCAGSLMSQVLQWTQFLRVDDEARVGAFGLVGIDDVVNASRAIEPRRLAIPGKVVANRNRRVAQLEVDRLILLMVGVRQEDRRGFVEGDLSIRLGIDYRPDFGERLQSGAVALAVLQRSEKRSAEEFVGPHVENRRGGRRPRGRSCSRGA